MLLNLPFSPQRHSAPIACTKTQYVDFVDDSSCQVKHQLPKTQSKLNFGPKSEPKPCPDNLVAAASVCPDKPVPYSGKAKAVKPVMIEPVGFDYVDSYDDTCTESVVLDEKQGNLSVLA